MNDKDIVDPTERCETLRSVSCGFLLDRVHQCSIQPSVLGYPVDIAEEFIRSGSRMGASAFSTRCSLARKRHTEEQILRSLRQAEGGTRLGDIREYGVSGATLYVWKKKSSGLALNQMPSAPLPGSCARETKLHRLLPSPFA